MKRVYWVFSCAVLLAAADGLLAQTRVLLIASSSGKGQGPFTTTISTPLTAAGYQVRTWTQIDNGWPPLDTLLSYPVVFFHGSERTTLPVMDSILTAYAESGGRLVTEGTCVPSWDWVYHDFNKHVSHSKWHGANVTNFTHAVTDNTHMLTFGLPATFMGSGYYPGAEPDIAETWRGGHRVISYSSTPGASAAIVYPRSVFFCESLQRISTVWVRDSLMVRAVRWALQNPTDAAVYDLSYELGHRAGENIPVQIRVRNWANAAASGTLILDASVDSVNWAAQDSIGYALTGFEQQTLTLDWHPLDNVIYYLRGRIVPSGTDEITEDNSMVLMVTTLNEGVHPRLFFRAEDVTGLRLRASTTLASFAQALQAWVLGSLTYPLPDPLSWPTVSFDNMGQVVTNAALQAVLNPTPTYIDFAKRMTLGLCRYPHFDTIEHPDQDIWASRSDMALAFAYDWLFDEFTPAERDTIRLKLVAQLERWAASWPQNVWWHDVYIHNHGWCNFSYAGTATLALLGDEPAADGWHQLCLSSLQNCLTLYGDVEDGSWYEAMNYWGLVHFASLTYLYLLREQLNIDYFNVPYIRSLANYRIYGSLPDVSRMVMINEALLGEWKGPENQLALAAREYRDGIAQWLNEQVLAQRGFLLEDPLYFFYYDPTVVAEAPTILAKVIPDQDTYFARSAWSPSATFFSLKCGLPGGRHAYTQYYSPGGRLGDFTYSHFHPDQNAFTIYCNGRYFIQSGGQQIPRQYTRNSTTILVNGHGQIGDSLKGTWPLPADPLTMNPHLAETFGTTRTDYVVGDATTSYPSTLGLQLFQRHFLYVRPSTFIIVDRLRTAAPSTFSFVIRNINNVFSWNTSRVLLTERTAQMTMHVLEPASWNASASFSYYINQGSGGWGLFLSNTTPDTSLRFFMVLHPVGQAEARVSLLAANSVYAAMRLRGDQGLETTTLIRYLAADSVTVDLLRTDAEVAVVMRDSIADALTGITVKNSRYLRWGSGFTLRFSAPNPSDVEWDYRGDTLALNGEVAPGMRFWAPSATVVVYDGFPIEFHREAEFVVIEADTNTPRPVSTLTIFANGDSIRLRWRHVRESTFGNPVVVTAYDIYRSTGDFQNYSLIGTVNAPDSVYSESIAGMPSDSLAVYYYVVARNDLLRGPVPAGVSPRAATPLLQAPAVKKRETRS